MKDPVVHESDGVAPGVPGARSTSGVDPANPAVDSVVIVGSGTEAKDAALFHASPESAAGEQRCAAHQPDVASCDASPHLSTNLEEPAALPAADDAGPGSARKNWLDVLRAAVRTRDHHVSDEEIFEVLNGNSGSASLLEAKGITLPMVCVWKVKYRHLTLDELRSARRNERLRRQLAAALVVTVVIGAASALVLGAARTAYTWMTGTATAAEIGVAADAARVANNRAAVANAPAETATLPPQEAHSAAGARSDGSAKSQAPPVQTGEEQTDANVSEAKSTVEYRIQVAAPATREEAEDVIAKLTAMGYHANVARAIVRNAEVFRVRVGPFETLQSAEEVAERLRQDGFSGAWIVR